MGRAQNPDLVLSAALGLILFLIAWWFAWELYQWLATTRLSQLPEWLKKKHFLIGFTAGIGTLFLALLILKVKIALFAVPLATLALFLLVVTKNDAKRLAFFMIGTGLLLTIVVELVYLVGDVGRMNVVFKLYHQAWMLLTLPLGLAVVTLFKDMSSWRTNRQYLFQIPLFILVFIALLFPVLASQDKMSDRMSPTAPKTLDGMKYMETSVYNMNGIDMDRHRTIARSNGYRITLRVHLLSLRLRRTVPMGQSFYHLYWLAWGCWLELSPKTAAGYFAG